MKNRYFIYNVEDNKLLTGIAKYLKIFENGDYKCSDADRDEIYFLIKNLIDFCESHGFYGNLWQGLITYFLLIDENPYTLAVERGKTGIAPGSYDLALHDIGLIMNLYNSDLSCFSKALDSDLSCLMDYKETHSGGVFNEAIRRIIMKTTVKLSNVKTAEEFFEILNVQYNKFGTGNIGLHKAFRINESGKLYPISRIANVSFDDLVGLYQQKEELIYNTASFLNDNPANNCLLYGDSGTGKSTCIKALANKYFDDGLRIIEIYKHELKLLNNLISEIKGRNYKFIIYMDDLSFEEKETEYKYLKALIEGGIEKRPDNVLIYATSNRRHLVRESFTDRNEDIHMNDTMQEKLSLYGRFGVKIYFESPDKSEYNKIIMELKEKYNISISDEELLKEANSWSVSHGGRSGRAAEQFLDYISGK